uniref:C2H2-type domain-containing protein n=1 Tax=Poecilia mexicana TaxID=48701 RepID=A0A3B3YJN2_9TELE
MKMADEEAEQDRGLVDSISKTIGEVRNLLEGLHEVVIRESANSPVQSSSDYCQEFCRTLLEFVGRWKTEEEPLPLVQVYMVALLSFAKASAYLSLQCESVPLVFAHDKLQENGITQLSLLCVLSQHEGIWSHKVLQSILSDENPATEHVEKFLEHEGPVLLQMRVKQLIKEKQLEKAALLAKICTDCSAFQAKGDFKQMYLVCLCGILEKDQLMEELSKEDCHDAIEMICNLESDGDDSAAFSLCSAFLTRQLLQGDTYCAWELTLFWSKLLKRLEPSDHAFLDRCRQMSVLSKSVYHILFFIKVIQSEITHVGLPVCIELCIMALRITSEDDKGKATVCKTISCLLPADLEVKRACQLTEFLLEPTVDSYYVVETLYNEPDQKLEEENMPIPNSLRCDLLLVLKTQWPFDPEFWDWKTLKRHCLSLMGNEASIVSSIDSLNDSENTEEEEDYMSLKDFNYIPDSIVSGTYDLQDAAHKKQKNREMKKLREKGFVSTRFRNWQAYMQYCVLCDKEFLGHRIVRHAQIHFSHGIYTCPICAETFISKDTFLPHVTSHVKLSCKERLTAMETSRALVNSKVAAPSIAILKAKTHNELQKLNSSLKQNIARVQRTQSQVNRCDVEVNDDNMCPVGTCKRRFKFIKNLIAHVKDHGDNEEAKTFLELQNNKVVCQYCRRHFVSVTHLNDHLQVHCGAKPYICIQLNCKASFVSKAKLLLHKKTHSDFMAKCMFPNCGKIFNAPFKLFDHESHHYKTFTCKAVGCGKVFHSQQQLDLHVENHATQDKDSSPRSPSFAKSQPGSSTNELSSQFPVKQEHSQENINSDASCYPNSGEFMTIQGLLKTSPEPVDTMDGCQSNQENFAAPSNVTALPPEQRPRFHCAFGTCTKTYSSYRSVSKHMKAVHPEFYEQWKVARTEIKISHIPVLNTSSGPLSSVSSLQKKQASPTELDPGPSELSASQQQWMTDIQCAFERLDLMRELPDQLITPLKQTGFEKSRPVSSKVKSQNFTGVTSVPSKSVVVKPFTCEDIDCSFSSVSSDSLWRHLSKAHNYTIGMVNEVKKRYGQYAPFKCEKCPKAFTRNSNLRIHYRSVHKLSNKEIAFLDEKRRLAKAEVSNATNHEYQGHNHSPPTYENGPFKMQTVVKQNKNIVRKSKGKKPKSEDAVSPYRPYRCVHQGCEAAFTIQQNLILHYRAVHQSALSALVEKPDPELLQITEFRCQVKDCCCVFQEIPNLFQHYLQLHEFTDDEVEALLFGIRLGWFACGHQGCTETFTAFRKYKSHVKEHHKDLNLAKPEQLQVFKCEIEGCDRSYATKSNMLRHMMKKHQDLYQLKLQNKQVEEDEEKQNSTSSHYQITKISNGKENIESNKKIPLRAHDRKKVDKSKSKHWLKYGKPSLKSKVDASALCTKKFHLQYPCMIKGCTSVMKSEKSILKHYIVHGLSEKYLEQHRSHFIFCKKFSRHKCRSIRSDDSKSENTSEQSDVEKTEAVTDEGKYEYSKPVLRRRSPTEMPMTLLKTKLSKKKSSDGLVLKRKRGRPRKFGVNFVGSKKVIRPTKTTPVQVKEEKQTCSVVPEETEQSVPLASFKPMGFEMSFLQFLEETRESEQHLMRPVKAENGESQTSSNGKKTCVWFSNRQNLKSLCKVKIKLDPAFEGVIEPMLKQLQDMDPAVVLERCD